MKLRSESRSVAPPETPIAFMLPATQAITISNASSPLLRLPQELKDRIYHFLYGGIYIHIRNDYCNVPTIILFACKDTDHHRFDACTYRRRNGWCGPPVASLRTCRQMYHEARNVLYSANDFSISKPKAVAQFLRHVHDVSHRSLAVRSLHLDVWVSNKNQEREWDNTFRVLVEDLKNIRHIYIVVDERIWNGYYAYTRRHSPAHGKGPFLRGLLELKKLPLKTVELVVTERTWGGRVRGSEYIWTSAQKREWAQSMKSAILGSG